MERVKNIKEKDFEIKLGENKIMLSAPHAVKQIRDGRVKASEPKTKEIVLEVAKMTNSCCMYKTKCLDDDANYDAYSYYREKCSNIVIEKGIKVLLDIHGMSVKRQEDICIGTFYGKNINGRDDILKGVIEILKNNGFNNVSIDVPFSANKKACVSSAIHEKCKIITFQIEINYRHRNTEYSLTKTIKALSEIVKYLNLYIE